MDLAHVTQELQPFISEVAPLHKVLIDHGFQMIKAELAGHEATGLPVYFVIFESPTNRIQINHLDGGINVHLGTHSAPLCLPREPEWQNIRSLGDAPSLAIEELLKRAPSRVLSMHEQSVELAPVLETVLAATGPAAKV